MAGVAGVEMQGPTRGSVKVVCVATRTVWLPLTGTVQTTNRVSLRRLRLAGVHRADVRDLAGSR